MEKAALYDLNLEMAVLGALMISNGSEKCVRVFNAIGENYEFFYDKRNREIHKAILQIREKSFPIDIMTVNHQLKINKPEFGPDIMYIVECTNRVHSEANILYHTVILTELYHRRCIKKVAMYLLKYCDDVSCDVISMIEVAKNQIDSAYQVFTDIKKVLNEK